jgi:hypothetical protein
VLTSALADFLNRQLEALNRGITLRSFRYPSVAPDLEALGFKMDSAYSSMINYLLRPKPSSLAFITQYTSLFSLPSVFSIVNRFAPLGFCTLKS